MRHITAIEKAKIRHKQVIQGLKDDIVIKAILSVLAGLWGMLNSIFKTPAEPLFLLILLVGIDWYTGRRRAKKAGEPLASLGLRQTWIKVVEYLIGLFIFSALANVFGRTELENWVGDILRFCKNIDWFAYFYVIITEMKSILENISGKKGRFSKIFEELEKKYPWNKEK